MCESNAEIHDLLSKRSIVLVVEEQERRKGKFQHL
jgi:hypothetical protein